MQKRVIFFLIGAFLFFVFVFFSYLVHKNLFTKTDFDTTVHLQDKISRRFDPYFSDLSAIGSFEVSLVILLIILALIRRWWVIPAFISFGGLSLIEIFGKSFVNHLPPPQFMLRTHLPFNFPQFTVREEYSYPSGHSGRTVFLSVLIGYLIFRSKKLTPQVKYLLLAVLIMYDTAMLISRVYLGEHWTSDVIGGMLLGLSLGLLNLSLAKE